MQREKMKEKKMMDDMMMEAKVIFFYMMYRKTLDKSLDISQAELTRP